MRTDLKTALAGSPSHTAFHQMYAPPSNHYTVSVQKDGMYSITDPHYTVLTKLTWTDVLVFMRSNFVSLNSGWESV